VRLIESQQHQLQITSITEWDERQTSNLNIYCTPLTTLTTGKCTAAKVGKFERLIQCNSLLERALNSLQNAVKSIRFRQKTVTQHRISHGQLALLGERSQTADPWVGYKCIVH